jgi:hypothetical protein
LGESQPPVGSAWSAVPDAPTKRLHTAIFPSNFMDFSDREGAGYMPVARPVNV